jgi:threonine aldolase
MNASVASGVPAAEYGALGDTVTLCFSKGLGCPLGAVLAGSREVMSKAWRSKFLFGGAMRQAGMVAAAALYALDHNVDRLRDDHARAKRLAGGLAEAGLPVDPAATETNFVGLEVEPLGISVEQATERIAEQGVLAGWLRPGVVRLATYLGVEDDDIEVAIEAISRALSVPARA